MKKFLYIILISMVPIIELRGALPVGIAMGLEWYYVFIACVIGNMIPVPFILLFIRKILRWMKTVPKLHSVAEKIEAKGEKNKHRVLQYAFFGLVLFVGIPVPGTGAWTGALIAAMLDMRMKNALPAIFLGVLLAGTIMTLASLGLVAGLDIFM